MRKASLADSIWVWAAAVLFAIGGLAAATYFFQRSQDEAETVPAATAAAAPPPAPSAASGTQAAPLPTRPAREIEPPPEPLPPLDESDGDVLGFLSVLFGAVDVARFVTPERIVRNTVVTIDNLAREKVNPQQRPIQPTPGEFLVEGTDDAPVLSPANYARYAPFVALVDAADTRTLVALYRRLYPLFREAYESLGYGSGNFNTRLLEVIENLLATPEVSGPTPLVRPTVLYEYADPALEALTPGQKLLLRMGPDHTRTLKRKLREIRDELT